MGRGITGSRGVGRVDKWNRARERASGHTAIQWRCQLALHSSFMSLEFRTCRVGSEVPYRHHGMRQLFVSKHRPGYTRTLPFHCASRSSVAAQSPASERPHRISQRTSGHLRVCACWEASRVRKSCSLNGRTPWESIREGGMEPNCPQPSESEVPVELRRDRTARKGHAKQSRTPVAIVMVEGKCARSCQFARFEAA
jgi:hypothetical protein